VYVKNFPALFGVTGDVNVKNFPTTFGITGDVTVKNFPTRFGITGSITGDVTVKNFPAAFGVTGSITGDVTVKNFPAAFGVTGSITGDVTVKNFPAAFGVNGSITGEVIINGIGYDSVKNKIYADVSGTLRTEIVPLNVSRKNLFFDTDLSSYASMPSYWMSDIRYDGWYYKTGLVDSSLTLYEQVKTQAPYPTFNSVTSLYFIMTIDDAFGMPYMTISNYNQNNLTLYSTMRYDIPDNTIFNGIKYLFYYGDNRAIKLNPGIHAIRLSRSYGVTVNPNDNTRPLLRIDLSVPISTSSFIIERFGYFDSISNQHYMVNFEKNTTTTNDYNQSALNVYQIMPKEKTYLFNAYVTDYPESLAGYDNRNFSTTNDYSIKNARKWYANTNSSTVAGGYIYYEYVDQSGNAGNWYKQLILNSEVALTGFNNADISLASINKYTINRNINNEIQWLKIYHKNDSGNLSVLAGQDFKFNANGLFTCPNNAIAWVSTVTYYSQDTILYENLRLYKWDALWGKRTCIYHFYIANLPGSFTYTCPEYGFGGYITAGDSIAFGVGSQADFNIRYISATITVRYL
jgi:hypothetical protein